MQNILLMARRLGPADMLTSADASGHLGLRWTLERERQAFERWMRDSWLTHGGGAIPIAELKMWLALMGLPQGPVRPPLIPLSRAWAGPAKLLSWTDEASRSSCSCP